MPDRAFTASERVSVRAALSSPAAGTASGVPDATALDFAFTVATPPPSTMASAATRSRASNPPPTQSFHSSSMRPPVAIVSGNDPDASSGDVFLGAATGAENGAMILDGRGRLVWFDPVPKGTVADDVNEQSYRGKPVVTWWQGRVASGHGLGEDVIDNDSYQTVATVHAGEGYHADLHEFQITPQGTALITIYEPTRADLSSVGGPKDGVVLDSIVQEIDIKTGRVLWEWHALGHVPLSASEAGKPAAGNQYDYFHVNSIQQLPDGNLLVSARNTWGVYEISRSTGKVIWTLGGKDSDFKPGPGTGFEWQHDVRMQPDGTLTLFDDADSPEQESQSRAIRLTLGAEPDFSEYTPGGHQIFNVSFAPPDESYRAFRHPWTAQPTTHPSIAASATKAGGLAVYASWNGATNVARWQLIAGPSPSQLTPHGPAATRTGFETEIATTTSQRYLAVVALDSSGRALATSTAHPNPERTMTDYPKIVAALMPKHLTPGADAGARSRPSLPRPRCSKHSCSGAVGCAPLVSYSALPL